MWRRGRDTSVGGSAGGRRVGRGCRGQVLGRLNDQVAVVTGGARGIGASICRRLSEENATVFAADILGKAAADPHESTTIRHLSLDVTSQEDWRQAIEHVESSAGPVSVLVNNAGIVDFDSIEHQDPDAFRQVLDVNLYGAWLGLHVTGPSLRRAGGAVVINMSSTAGLMGYAHVGAYVASKWGLRGLTKTAALEFAAAGVRVCSLHPGPIRTPMTAGLDEALVAGQPMPRFGEPDEVAKMALFLIADASYSTGTEFVVDGGATVGAGIEVPENQ